MSDRTPYNFPHGNGYPQHAFSTQNNSKISTLIKVCRSLSVKNYHAKGRELTPRMDSQLRVDRRSQKISAVLSAVKASVGKIPRAPYVSTETIAHGTMSCDCSSTRST